MTKRPITDSDRRRKSPVTPIADSAQLAVQQMGLVLRAESLVLAFCNLSDMIKAADMPGWRDVELGAPEIARLGMARLNATRVAMLGTLRRDGSPRISPIEPCIVGGRLLVGAMTRSGKAADLRRDPRYVLHSTVAGPDRGEGELKLHGIAAEAGLRLRGEAAGAWWLAQPAEKAVVFVMSIRQALFVTWNLKGGVMTVHRWSPQDGYSHSARTYP